MTSLQQGLDVVPNPKWSCRHTCCSLPWTSSHLHQEVRNKRCADSVQYRLIQSDLLSKCNPAVEHSAGRHLPATSWQVSRPTSAVSVSFEHRTMSCFYCLYCTAPFLSKSYCSLFAAHCTAFSIHICLFTCGGLLLEIESALLSEKDFTRNFATMDSRIANFDADTKGFISTLYYIIYYFVTSIIVINLLVVIHQNRLLCSLEKASLCHFPTK